MPRSDPIKMTLSPEVIKVSTSPSDLMEVKDIFCGADEPEVRTPISSSRLFGKPEDVVPATPDSCFVNFPSDVPENVSPHTSSAGASYIDFSPRLRNLAKRGIVPESPIATVTKCAIAEREPKNQYASNLMANGTRSHQKSPAFGIVASSWEEPHTYLREKGIADVANTNTEICKTPRENEFTAPADVSQEVLKENNMKLKDSSPFSEAGPQNLAARRSLQDDAKKLNFEFLSVSKSLAIKATSTPANNLSSKSCSEDWQLSSAEAAKSVQKARKFKRLCKYKDRAKGKFSATPTEIPSKSKTKLDNLSVGVCRKSRLLKGRQYSNVSVHPFIDEEAEVSSDEQSSTDEDDDNEDAGDEGESESDSFIDDRIEPTAAPTQAEGHHVDMMAIYRKSLLTQSPLDDELNPWDHFHRSHISPGCTGSESSAASEKTFVSEDSLVGTDSRSLAASPRPSAVHDSPIKTSSSGCLGINDVVKGSEIVDLNAGSSEERNSKIESRKRKLSFHQVNAPANLKLLENQVSSLLGGNLKEKLNESCNQNQHIDGTFDDGLFEGLDLDALEAEAAEMVRARPNITLCMQQTIPIVPSCVPYTHTLDMGSSVKPFLNNTTSIQQPTRMPLAEAFDVQNCINDKDNSNDCSTAGGVKEKNQETGIDVDLDFLCTPSFDLGI